MSQEFLIGRFIAPAIDSLKRQFGAWISSVGKICDTKLNACSFLYVTNVGSIDHTKTKWKHLFARRVGDGEDHHTVIEGKKSFFRNTYIQICLSTTVSSLDVCNLLYLFCFFGSQYLKIFIHYATLTNWKQFYSLRTNTKFVWSKLMISYCCCYFCFVFVVIVFFPPT